MGDKNEQCPSSHDKCKDTFFEMKSNFEVLWKNEKSLFNFFELVMILIHHTPRKTTSLTKYEAKPNLCNYKAKLINFG
jgi:hypothetical protein